MRGRLLYCKPETKIILLINSTSIFFKKRVRESNISKNGRVGSSKSLYFTKATIKLAKTVRTYLLGTLESAPKLTTIRGMLN